MSLRGTAHACIDEGASPKHGSIRLSTSLRERSAAEGEPNNTEECPPGSTGIGTTPGEERTKPTSGGESTSGTSDDPPEGKRDAKEGTTTGSTTEPAITEVPQAPEEPVNSAAVLPPTVSEPSE